MGVWGRSRPPVGSRGNSLGGGQGANPPEAESFFFFLNLWYVKSHFLALYPVSDSHSQNTLYSASRLSSRETNQAQTNINVQRLYTSNINNKGCTHSHLSFWSNVLVYVGRSSCQQLTNDSIQKRKACFAPGNEISKASNELHQSMFGNNWWQLWLHWRQWQINRAPVVVHWSGCKVCKTIR